MCDGGEGQRTFGRVTLGVVDDDCGAGVAHESVALPSHDGHTTCHGDLWFPSPSQPRALVLIHHGMVEHLTGYRFFARCLVHAGYAVAGLDALGHGRSVGEGDERGVYDPVTGADDLIEDVETLREGLVERFDGIPVFLLGHSMGSFVVRCYATRHGDKLCGMIVMGTGWQPRAALVAGTALCNTLAARHGWSYRSPFVDKLGCGGYNKRFEGTGDNTGYEWLSRDPVKPLAYAADPDCGWMFSISGYRTLFRLLTEAQDPVAVAKVPANLHILILSGADDPVGDEGDGPVRVFRLYKELGVEDVTLDLFDGARHELLCETCVEPVVTEILQWMSASLHQQN